MFQCEIYAFFANVFSYFTWDKDRFDTSAKMIEKLSGKRRKMVNTIDPHLKRDDRYHVYADARDQSLFINDRTGSVYDGWCWPGKYQECKNE